MAYTESNMLPLGTIAPQFSLPDTISGNTCTPENTFGERATVLMFLCNHCPYVIYVNPEIVRLVAHYQSLGVAFVGISSNDVSAYPEDGPEQMKRHATEVGFEFPYLYDESQAVARAYDAACTPDFYVFDAAKTLVYRGQIDSSRPRGRGDASSLTGADLRAALNAVLAGNKVADVQRPSGGCGIKWKEA